jgi:hypothetical protein
MNQAVTAMDLSAKLYTVSASVPGGGRAIPFLFFFGGPGTLQTVAP